MTAQQGSPPGVASPPDRAAPAPPSGTASTALTVDAASRARSVGQALRPQQWVKNLLLFVPMVLDHKLLVGPVLLKAAYAFVAFCCAASGAYVLNDLLDVEADRRHPTKRHRPFAVGTLPVSFGWVLVPALLGSALLVGLVALPRSFVALLAFYVMLTGAYSVYFKRLAVIDVILLAGFYTLRVLAGVAATGVRLSTWFLAFSMFLFLSLAFLKRFSELRHLPEEGDTWLERRGYTRSDRELLATMGAASGYLSVLVLALYVRSEEVVALYSRPTLLLLICPLLLYWVSRMWLHAHRGQLNEDPIVAAVRDPFSYAVGLCVGAIMIAAL